MKRTIVVMLILSFVLLCSVIGVSAAPGMRVSIPFAFYANGQLMPAGEYWFEFHALGVTASSGSYLAIRNSDGSIFAYLTNRATGSYSKDPAAAAMFNRYGDSYFLAKVINNGLEAGLTKTRAEKELQLAYSKSLKPASIGTTGISVTGKK